MKPKVSYAELIQKKGFNPQYNQESADPHHVDRYVHFEGWDFYESGRIVLNTHFGKNPDVRVRVARTAGVRIALAKDYPCKFKDEDGTVIPKTWLRDNPILLHDEEFNIVLPLSAGYWGQDRLYYPHHMAQPIQYDTSPYRTKGIAIGVYRPNPAKAKAALACEYITNAYKVGRAAYKLTRDLTSVHTGSPKPAEFINLALAGERPDVSDFVRLTERLDEEAFRAFIREECVVHEKHSRLAVITHLNN